MNIQEHNAHSMEICLLFALEGNSYFKPAIHISVQINRINKVNLYIDYNMPTACVYRIPELMC